MNILTLLQSRIRPSLAALVADRARLTELLGMIRPAQDAKFGDYQANFAMPLKKDLGKSPQQIAADIVAVSQVADLCQPPEIAGPGFINLRLRDDWPLSSRGRW
jgi:arginyl-tRNA synthetase